MTPRLTSRFLYITSPAAHMRHTSPPRSGSRRSATCIYLIKDGNIFVRRFSLTRNGLASSPLVLSSRLGRMGKLHLEAPSFENGTHFRMMRENFSSAKRMSLPHTRH